MKAIRIDAKNQTISMIDIEKGLATLQEHVGGYIEAALYFPDGDVMYVNEEGLLNNPEHFQFWPKHKRMFAGDGIIVGSDDEGNDIDTTLTIKDIEDACVEFVNQFEALIISRSLGI